MENEEKGRYVLAVFRILVGWLLLWGFLDKMFGLGFQTPAGQGMIDGVSPSSFVIYASGGIFADLFKAMGGNLAVDLLFMAGLLIIGILLIVGMASRITTILTMAFMAVMFLLQVPPVDNPLIDYHILLLVAMPAVYWLGGFDKLSVNEWWCSTVFVERFPFLG